MQELRGEEDLAEQGPRGPPGGEVEEEVPSSRGPQRKCLEQDPGMEPGPQLDSQGSQEPDMCGGAQGGETGRQERLGSDTGDCCSSPQCPKETSNSQIHPCLWTEHSLSIGIQEAANSCTDQQPGKSHQEPMSNNLGSQEPTQNVGPHTPCVQLGSMEPPLRLAFQNNLQEPFSLQKPPLPISGLRKPLNLGPSDIRAISSTEMPIGHRPGSESHVQFGQEELPDEEFPLLVDAFSVLGLHEEHDEEPEFEGAMSRTPSPESEDLFREMTMEHLLSCGLGVRRRGVNMTEGVPVPSSEHVAEIVGRQGCKIKALRAKTNTYIKTPVRGEEPVFIVTGRKEDVEMAKREILAAADHFSIIRATRNKNSAMAGGSQGPPNLPGQTTIQVRVPYRVVGLVVGPKGATIKRIQQSTHTYIVTPSRDKEPVFEVTGMPENVDRAREEIEAHITMRTGSVIDIHPDNDFHSNGTDVCMDLFGNSSAALWAKVNAPRRGSAASRNETLGSTSSESSCYGTGREQGPASPFRPVLGGGFTLGEQHTVPAAISTEDCEFGFEFLSLDLNTPTAIWSPFETSSGQVQNFSGCSAQRRNSGLSVNSTSRISPTLPEPAVGLEHPLARRIHSDPINGISWLATQGSLSSFSSSTGYSSSSSLPGSSSVASGSPTDSSSSDGQRKSGRDCVVCYESEVIAALVPCGHNLFCMECAIRICERALPECPACHTPATQAIRIFS
ncbi:RNA-binding MEX3D [Pelobates cultripes]|uniref:RNA-binding MEX3D n=2 Tax=Pelobates cultripes TaxID=61616 RepID=A0AAD1S8V7_PELCU|nr:RNA-binding MEX3D [Pelobates cultripes]